MLEPIVGFLGGRVTVRRGLISGDAVMIVAACGCGGRIHGVCPLE
jgi:hypothetical protein